MARAQSPLPSDAEIDGILAERIDYYQSGVGMVVGVIGPEGRRIVTHGVRDPGDRRPLDADTEFEVGSITKAFVGLLLEDMVGRGEVKLSDPINRFLPPQAQTPLQDGRAITLLDLATHTSGLPEEPPGLDPKNPFASYSTDQLATFLSTYRYPWAIGSRFDYSNLGYGLLGYGLGRAGRSDLPSLARDRILQPLGLSDTAFKLSPDQAGRLAPGHDAALQPTPPWDHSSLFEGSGAYIPLPTIC